MDTNTIANTLLAAMQAAASTDISSLKFIGAGLTMLGALGTSLGQGFIGGKSLEALSRNPEISDQIFKQYIISAAICESVAIYCLIITLIMISL